MSRTAIIGAFGVGKQSAKDTMTTTTVYSPALSVGLNYAQNAQTIPAEIGGSYFLRGSYKPSISGGGDNSQEIRPNSFTYLAWALCGQDTVTAVAGQSGAYQHVFTPFVPAAGVDLPWLTLYKDISKLAAEQYLNSKMQSLKVSIPKSALATCQHSWISTTPSTIAIAGLPTETFDSTPVFQTAVASYNLTQEGGSVLSVQANKTEGVNIQFGNNLSNDEFSVGNLFMEDITLLQKTAMVNIDTVVRDTAMYQAVYLNGGSIPNSWSPTIYRGTVSLTLNSSTNIPGTTQPYSLNFTFPGLNFLAYPISLQGSDLVRASLATQVTLGPSGGDTYSITLINGVSASY